jgi:hypothetical protein
MMIDNMPNLNVTTGEELAAEARKETGIRTEEEMMIANVLRLTWEGETKCFDLCAKSICLRTTLQVKAIAWRPVVYVIPGSCKSRSEAGEIGRTKGTTAKAEILAMKMRETDPETGTDTTTTGEKIEARMQGGEVGEAGAETRVGAEEGVLSRGILDRLRRLL